MRIGFVAAPLVLLAATPATAEAPLGPLLVASADLGDTLPSYSAGDSRTNGTAQAKAYFHPKGVISSLATASAEFGTLRVYAAAGSDIFSYVTVGAGSAFFDPVAFLPGRGRPGRGALTTFTFRVTGATVGSGGPESFGGPGEPTVDDLGWSVGLYRGSDLIGGTSGDQHYVHAYGTAAGTVSGDPLGIESFSIPTSLLGGPLALVATLSCSASGLGTCIANHSFDWGGIVTTDADGTRLATDVASASGFDYSRHASGFIPEPTSWALLVTGFGLVGAIARRRTLVAA